MIHRKVLVSLTWIVASVSLSYCNKALMESSVNAVGVVAVQMAFTALFDTVFLAARRVSLHKAAHKQWAWVVTPFFVSSLILSMLMYRHLTLGAVVVFHNTRPMLLFAAEKLMFETNSSLKAKGVAIVLIVIGGVLYSGTVPIDVPGSLVVFLVTCFWATDILASRFLLKYDTMSSELHPVGVSLVNNLIGLPMTFLAWEWLPYEHPYTVLASCASAVAISTVTPIVQSHVSATMFVVLGVLAKLVVSTFGIAFFGDPFTLLAVVGLSASFAGSLVYALNEKPEKYNLEISLVSFGQRLKKLWKYMACILIACVVTRQSYIVTLVMSRQPYVLPTPNSCTRIVPRILHATGKDALSTLYTNRSTMGGYEIRYMSDSQAVEFVRRECGERYARAMECLIPGAFRADLFRMCALYAVGGVYMDSDILAVEPLDDTFDGCAPASIAMDKPHFSWFFMRVYEKKQMAFMAAAPGHPLFACHMDAIAEHVEKRYMPEVDIQISGPIVFHSCYSQHSSKVSVALIDTGWPCSLFVTASGTVAAVQIKKGPSKRPYTTMFENGMVYRC